MILYRLLIVTLGLFVIVSCDDALEVDNPNAPTKEGFFTNLDQSQLVLNAAYASLLDDNVIDVPNESFVSDIGHPGGRLQFRIATGDNFRIYNQIFSNRTRSIESKWDALYAGVLRANIAIEGIEELRADFSNSERWEEQYGEAHFLRALFHFFLYSIYNEGSIIVRDKVPVTLEDQSVGLSTAEEVLQFIREDLEIAIENLPFKGQSTEGDVRGPATKGSAVMIQGLTYFYEKDYQRTIEILEPLIFDSEFDYRLVDPSEMYTLDGEFNDESIFEISFTTDFKIEQNVFNEFSLANNLAQFTVANNPFRGNNRLVPAAWLTNQFMQETSQPISVTDEDGNSIVLGDPLLDTQDPDNFINDENGVPVLRNMSRRVSAMIAVVKDDTTPYYLRETTPQAFSFNQLNFSYFKKYSNHDIASSENRTPGGNQRSGKNYIINRLAEVYLVLAESYLEVGDASKSLGAVNRLRERWGLKLQGRATDFSSYSGLFDFERNDHDFVENNMLTDTALLMDHIRHTEKPKELCLEGHSIRTMDLRRWGIKATRFFELSQEDYRTISFGYTDAEDQERTRFNSLVIPGKFEFTDNVDESTLTTTQLNQRNFVRSQQTVPREYIGAASNYTPEKDYYPIPLEERRRNTKISLTE